MSNRNMRRAAARRAYDELSAIWRRDRRYQDRMLSLGMPEKIDAPIGRKPTFHQFMKIVGDNDALKIVRESQPYEFLEYARAVGENWQGRDVTIQKAPSQEGERGVMEIPMFGDDVDDR